MLRRSSQRLRNTTFSMTPKQYVLSETLSPLIKEALDNEQVVMLTVTGHSMRPFLKHQKTTVSLQRTPYQKYDILLYTTKDDKLVLHRLINNTKPLVTCGDALMNNELVHPKQVLGKVIKIEHKKRTITTTQKGYRFKVKLWLLLKPLRPILLKLFARIKR